MKIGFLLCAYNQEEFIHDCLRDLVKFSKENGHVISAASVPFKEYEDMGVEVDDTTEILRKKVGGDIDYLVDSPQFISEAEARTLALKPLLEEGCTYVHLIDSDEVYSYDNLNNIVNYLARDEFIDWYSVCLKNYVGEGYLEEPFTPPRIFKVKSRKGALTHFYFDNDVIYGEVSYKGLSNKVIPKEIAFVPHFSWTNTEKNKAKIAYQSRHFSHFAGCGYQWDEERGVVFNEEYYKKTGQPMSKIIVENNQK
jgi:hypothetical protein